MHCFQKPPFHSRFCIIAVAVLHVLVCWVTPGFAQISPDRYVVDHWTTENSLPVNSINEVIQDKNGYIWMATFDGVVRFDGLNMKIFNVASHPELISNRIIRIIELNDGSLWFLSEQRFLVRYFNGSMERIDNHPDFHGIGAFKFFEDHRGWLWIGSDEGLNIYRDGKIEPFEPEILHGTIDKIYIEQSGAVWYRNRNSLNILRYQNGRQKVMARAISTSDYTPMIQGRNGLLYLSTGEGTYIYKADSLLQEYPQISKNHAGISFHEEPDGSILMATISGRTYRFQNTQAELLPESNSSPGLHDFSFFRDEQDQLWKFTRNKVYKNGQLVFEHDAFIRNVLVDREGSIWLATDADGLLRLKPSIFKIYSEAQGLPMRNVYPILETFDKSIWIGTNNKGLARISDGKIESGFYFEHLGTETPVRALAQLADSTILVGLNNKGLYRWAEKDLTFYQVAVPAGIYGTGIHSIFEDSEKTLWLGTRNGLYARTDTTWAHFSHADVLPNNYIRYITEAEDGSLWFATNGGGVVRFQNGSFTTFGITDGLSSNLIREIHIEPKSPQDYVLWIGTEGMGLNRAEIKNGKWQKNNITVYTKDDGLFDNVIHRILDDDKGQFWMSSNRGIFRVSKTELEAFHAGKITEIQSVEYTEKDGLLNREANGGVQPAGIKASDGRLWFPTQNGAVVIDTDNIQVNNIMPSVIIETLTANNKVVWDGFGFAPKLELQTGMRDFEVAYTALSLLVAEKNQFKYKLEGFDHDWRQAGNRRTAFYTNVPPGEYTFRVIASNNNGVWNAEGDSLNIIVPAYFTETPAFFVICIALIVLLIATSINLRTRRLAKAEKQLIAIVKMRTNELQSEKKKTEEQAEELKKLNAIKSRLFTNLSHEFRTPLTLIISPLRQMLNGAMGSFSDEVTKRHELMLRNGFRLLRLINQLLDLSKMEEGRIQIEAEKMEIIAFCKRICELFEHTAAEKNIRLTVHDNGSKCYIWADKEKIEKVIANLISNAIKYTEAGGTVDVKFEQNENTCRILVNDTGSGLSDEQMKFIFDRFYQARNDEAQHTEGVGIGLAVVREFTELHGGEVLVESKKGEGSTFTVVLKKDNRDLAGKDLTKISAASHHDLDLRHEPTHTRTPAKMLADNLSSKEDLTSVLIVEDNKDMRMLMNDILSKRYRVFEADNGISALQIIRKELPDLVVADIMMPEMDGHSLNQEVKKDPSLACIPFIFLSAKTANEEKIKGFLDGADDYLTKPFDADVLLARIHNLINSRMRLRKQIQAENTTNGLHLDEYEDPFLEKLNTLLEKSFGNPDLSVSNISEQLHLDRSQLYRKLKAKTQLTPQQYILQYRLNKAIHLFHEKRGSVSEIAYATGFNSLSYFAKQFRNQFGVNPSEFLASLNTPETNIYT